MDDYKIVVMFKTSILKHSHMLAGANDFIKIRFIL